MVKIELCGHELELKGIKVHPSMSEETVAFSATMYIDGAKAGEVKNSGRGGCHDVRVNGENMRLLQNIAAQKKYELGVEEIIDELMDRYHAEARKAELVKSIRKRAAKGVWFLKAGAKKGQYSFYPRRRGIPNEHYKEGARKSDNFVKFVEDMTDDEIINHFCE